MKSPQLHAYPNSVSIGKLPAELLCVVFDIAVESEWRAVYTLFGHTVFPPAKVLRRVRLEPFVIAAVCRAWRAAALQYSPLWSRVVLDPLDIMTTSDSALWTSYFETLENRSSRSPVELVVHLVNQSVITNSVGPAVFRMAARARSVTLNAARSNSWSPRLINRITQYGGKHLESFMLHTSNQLLVMHLHLSFFPDVCRLRTLRLDGFSFLWESLNLASVQKATIKRYRTQGSSLDDWRRLLAALPNCTDLAMDMGDCQVSTGSASTDLKPITAHNVRSLALSLSYSGQEASLFRFPALQRVQLQFTAFTTLAAFIQHSLGASIAQNLTFMSILVSFCDCSIAIALKFVPTIQELELVACRIGEDFFQTMSRDRDILPHLQIFTWRQPGSVGEHASPLVESEGVTRVGLEGGLLDFVRQRVVETTEGRRLRSVKLSGWPQAWTTTTEKRLLQTINELLLVSPH